MDDHGRPGGVADGDMSRHRTAVCTIATGPHEDLYEVAGPSFERFADHHGYDLVVARHDLGAGRPPSWGKLPLVRELLDSHDRVVWIDVDAVIVDPRGDIFEHSGRRQPFCVAVHRYDGFEIPNLGVIALRSTRWTKRFIERLWATDGYIAHKWWENAAALEMLGYDVEDPRSESRRRTATSRRVGELDVSWNSISLDQSPNPRIVHFPGMSNADRLTEMQRALDLAETGMEPSDASVRRAIVDDDVGRRGLEHLARAVSR
jgi:hypothetical protein